MKIVFLDVDGVLNSERSIDMNWNEGINDGDDAPHFIHTKHLNNILQNTGAGVVVSSSWRSKERHMNKLMCGLEAEGCRINHLGNTPVLDEGCRGDEIQMWMDDCEYEIESFIILDDESSMGHLTSSLIKTDYSTGLMAEHAESAVRILNEVYNEQ